MRRTLDHSDAYCNTGRHVAGSSRSGEESYKCRNRVTSPAPLLLPPWKVRKAFTSREEHDLPTASHRLSSACGGPSAKAFQSEVLGCVRDVYLTNELVSAADSACTQPTKSLQGLSLIKCKQV